MKTANKKLNSPREDRKDRAAVLGYLVRFGGAAQPVPRSKLLQAVRNEGWGINHQLLSQLVMAMAAASPPLVAVMYTKVRTGNGASRTVEHVELTEHGAAIAPIDTCHPYSLQGGLCWFCKSKICGKDEVAK